MNKILNLNIKEKDFSYNQESKSTEFSIDDPYQKIQIRYTLDQELFFTQRSDQELLTYTLPLPEDGIYTIITKHAENKVRASGQRVFDIMLGFKVVQEKVDVFQEMGFKSGHNTYTEIEIRNQKIFQNGKLVQNAVAKNFDGDLKVLQILIILKIKN